MLANVVVFSPADYERIMSDATPRYIEPLKALVDTGAELTCIGSEFAERAGFPVIGKRELRSASGVFQHNEYFFHLGFQPSHGPVLFFPTVIRGPDFHAASDGYDLLIGMDVISTGVLTVGPGNSATFGF